MIGVLIRGDWDTRAHEQGDILMRPMRSQVMSSQVKMPLRAGEVEDGPFSRVLILNLCCLSPTAALPRPPKHPHR